ncbi:MAG: MFS transporter [Planctomycetota bacterium]|nr:MAG: MFS transporter [Planctomycetota bacterium]
MARISPRVFRLVLVVSCAHALVHVFELSLPAVEQLVAQDFGVGRDVSGWLGTTWRLPFGGAALLAGWLADRFGSVRLLLLYLLGCSLTALSLLWLRGLPAVFVLMFLMGMFASIYHPAGLAFISRATGPRERPVALGWHGIFGSAGIAGAPFLASAVFLTGSVSWRGYYALLSIPAALVGLLLWLVTRGSAAAGETQATQQPPGEEADGSRVSTESFAEHREDDAFHRGRFLCLVTGGALSGFVYAAFMHFLPRYLDAAGLRPAHIDAAGFRNALAALVLICGAVGQGIAGRWADPQRLPRQLTLVFLANVPFLVWMAFAEGVWRLVAPCLLALVHFMNQPLYNSLIARFVPAARRSTGYGFSNMVCFGIGALGPAFAGAFSSDRWVYGGLAVVAGLAAAVVSAVTLPRSVDAAV